MNWFKKRKIKKLREEITTDAELLPDQKELALQRLDNKERQLFSPDSIAQESQDLLQSLLPTIVGKVQVKRLQTRNEVIREIRTTLNELAETKKAWARLRDIDEEIAAEQVLRYMNHDMAQAQLGADTAKHHRERQKHEFGMEEDKLQHLKRVSELQAEIRDLKKKEEEEKSKAQTLGEKKKALEEEFEFRKTRLLLELELKQIEYEFARKNPDPKTANELEQEKELQEIKAKLNSRFEE